MPVQLARKVWAVERLSISEAQESQCAQADGAGRLSGERHREVGCTKWGEVALDVPWGTSAL